MGLLMNQEMMAEIESVVPWAVKMRQELHKWPETGNQEHWTTGRILEELKRAEIHVETPLGTGVVGFIKGEKSGPVIGLRADIDGLPIHEKILLPYSSARPGFMHACGHDVHTSILLGVAKVLAKKKKYIAGSIKLIFQPAEETEGGAERMIYAGCLKNPAVDRIYGLHVKPELLAGEIGLKRGKVHAASDEFRILVMGVTGHGARPETGIDAIAAASQIVCSLHSIASRSVNPVCPTVISIGSFHGGQAVNIICDTAELKGTIRSFDPAIRENLKHRVREVAEFTAMAYGARTEISFLKGYDALINHDEPLDMVEQTGVALLGQNRVIHMEDPSLGAEDFAYYLNQVPGAFFFLGSGFPFRENQPLHSDQFHVNESCIATGIKMLCGLCLPEEQERQ